MMNILEGFGTFLLTAFILLFVIVPFFVWVVPRIDPRFDRRRRGAAGDSDGGCIDAGDNGCDGDGGCGD